VLDGVVFTEESDNEQADRNLTRLLLQFDREEGESEDEQELGPELLSQIKKMKIGKSTKSCSVCLLPFEKGNTQLTSRKCCPHSTLRAYVPQPLHKGMV